MSLFMTAQDVTNLLRFATYSAASKLGVPNAEWEESDHLEQAITLRNVTVGKALHSFKEAYIDWFHFWEEQDAEGATSNIRESDLSKLSALIMRRDSTRTDLISLLRSL